MQKEVSIQSGSALERRVGNMETGRSCAPLTRLVSAPGFRPARTLRVEGSAFFGHHVVANGRPSNWWRTHAARLKAVSGGMHVRELAPRAAPK